MGDDSPDACLRWASAYCSRASCEGSFSERKPKTALAFFFLLDVLESLEDPALEYEEARLDDVRLSNDGRLS